MWFWWFLLVCDCLIPLIMIICGRWMWKHYPKQTNSVVGYRTKMSMKNMDTWKFAHEYAGKLWWKLGMILIVLTILVHLPFHGVDDDTIGFFSIIVMIVQLIVLIVSILPTEKALKQNFNEDGTKR